MMEHLLATFNGRNMFNICTQKRLKGTQKGPKLYFTCSSNPPLPIIHRPPALQIRIVPDRVTVIDGRLEFPIVELVYQASHKRRQDRPEDY